jgi:hypothetical protein
MEHCELCATSRFGGINLVSFVVNSLATRRTILVPPKQEKKNHIINRLEKCIKNKNMTETVLFKNGVK